MTKRFFCVILYSQAYSALKIIFFAHNKAVGLYFSNPFAALKNVRKNIKIKIHGFFSEKRGNDFG